MALTFHEEVRDGGRTLFPVQFAYISTDDVYVYTGEHSEYATQVSYRWADSSTIELTNTLEVPEGTKFTIRRVMDRTDLIHKFADKSIRAGLIDQENLHALYLIQELQDGFLDLNGIINPRGNIDMGEYLIKRLGDAQEETDAVNVRVARAIMQSLDSNSRSFEATFLASESNDLQSFPVGEWLGLDSVGYIGVHVNGYKQIAGVAYSYTDDGIVGMAEPLEEDDSVTFTVGFGEVIPNLGQTNRYRTTNTARAGQTVLITPPYKIGRNELLVFINTALQAPTAYTEIGPTQVELSEGLEEGDIIDIVRFE